MPTARRPGSSRHSHILLPDLLVVEDLAPFLRISAAGVRRLLREGVLPGRRVGRRWVIERQTLLEALRRVPRVTERPARSRYGRVRGFGGGRKHL